MSPFDALVLAVALGTTVSLSLYFLFRGCIESLELYEHKIWVGLIYSLSPLIGITLILTLYYGIISAALTSAVGYVLAIFVALLVGILSYLILVVICPCLPAVQQNILALVVSIILTPLSAAGIVLLIKPHIPLLSTQLSLESSGAAILGGLMVFSGVGAISYLGDMYYRYKKEKKDAKRREPPKSNVETWEKDIEKHGFEILHPDQGNSFFIDRSEKDEKSPVISPVSVDNHIREAGEKKVTLTVEDSGMVYNFALYLTLQEYQEVGSFEAFKLAGIRRCLTYNPDIYDLEIRRVDGSAVDGSNFWDKLGDDEMFLAIAKSAPPPMLRREKGRTDGPLDQP